MGKPTAFPKALDADAILATVAVELGRGGDLVTIAATNQRQRVGFPGVDARSRVRTS